ncbi:MAG: hypothetical protein K2Q28_01250 [Hyphomicrobium sp.]|nr:hypothetical protein [Hyphomicrobium sp.]
MIKQPLVSDHARMAEFEGKCGCEASMSPAVVSPGKKLGARDMGIPGQVSIKRGFGEDRRASQQQRPHPIERTQTWI